MSDVMKIKFLWNFKRSNELTNAELAVCHLSNFFEFLKRKTEAVLSHLLQGRVWCASPTNPDHGNYSLLSRRTSAHLTGNEARIREGVLLLLKLIEQFRIMTVKRLKVTRGA